MTPTGFGKKNPKFSLFCCMAEWCDAWLRQVPEGTVFPQYIFAIHVIVPAHMAESCCITPMVPGKNRVLSIQLLSMLLPQQRGVMHYPNRFQQRRSFLCIYLLSILLEYRTSWWQNGKITYSHFFRTGWAQYLAFTRLDLLRGLILSNWGQRVIWFLFRTEDAGFLGSS